MKIKVYRLAITILLLFFLSCNVSGGKNKPISEKTSVSLNKSDPKDIEQDQYDGKWIFQDASLIGGYKEGVDYYYDQNQLDTIHKNLVIIIENGTISYRGTCTSDIEEVEMPMEDFFMGKVDESTKKKDIISYFNNDFNISLGKDILLYEAKECSYPFNKIIVFPNKLVLVEYGAFYFSFVRQNN